MLKQRTPILTEEQQKLLKDVIENSPRPIIRQRAHALLLLYEGFRPTNVAETMQVSRSAVYAWYGRWREHGPSSLADRPRSGRPLKGDKQYQQVLEAALACDPGDLDLWFMSWSVHRLRDYMAQQTGIVLSVGRLRLLLKRLGYRYVPYVRTTPNPNPPPKGQWEGTRLEPLINALFAVRNQSLWGWKKQPAG